MKVVGALLLGLASQVTTACDGGQTTNIEPTLELAAQSDADLLRIAEAATGREALEIQRYLLEIFEHPLHSDPCPAIAIDDLAHAVTIVGGCQRADGTVVEGRAHIANPMRWADQLGRGRSDVPTRYELDLAVTQYGFEQAYTGYIELGPAGAYVDIDLWIAKLGQHVRTDVRIACGVHGCRVLGGGVELLGAGGVHVSGFASTNAGETHVELTGIGRLDFDMADGCRQWRVLDTPRSYISCP